MLAAKDEQSQGLASAPRRQRSGSISSLIPRVSTPGKSLVSRLRPWSALGGSRASSSRDTCQQQQQPADLPDERSAERSQSEFAQQLLAGVYKRRLPEHEAAAVLEACPEIEWLAECAWRTPLPPGWRKIFDDQGRAQYLCEETGGVSSALPHFGKYVYLAKVMAHVRTGSAQAANAIEWLRLVADEAQSEADSLKKVWHGPFKDPRSESEYYHDRLSGTSVWEAPWAGAEFLVRVVETLLGSDTLAMLRPRRRAEGDSAARKATSERPEPARMQGQGSRSPAPAAAARSSPGGDDEPGAGRCCDGAPGRAEAVDDGDPWTALDKLIEIGGHPPPAQQADDGLLDLEKLISSRQAKRQPPRTRAPLPPPQVDATAESSAVAPQGRSGAAPAPGPSKLPAPPAPGAPPRGPPGRPAAAWGEACPEGPGDTRPPPPPPRPLAAGAAGAKLPAAPE